MEIRSDAEVLCPPRAAGPDGRSSAGVTASWAANPPEVAPEDVTLEG